MNHKYLLGLTLFLFVSCNNKGETEGIADPSLSNSSTSTSTSCSSAVIDAGAKGAGSAVQSRGFVSDVKENPYNSTPATAYADYHSLSIKFSYWNGLRWIHETVAGAPATVTSVSMVFLSTGIPVVVWTAGTDVLIATRTTSTATASSSWNARILGTAFTATRAATIAATPTDLVGGAFLYPSRLSFQVPKTSKLSVKSVASSLRYFLM